MHRLLGISRALCRYACESAERRHRPSPLHRPQKRGCGRSTPDRCTHCNKPSLYVYPACRSAARNACTESFQDALARPHPSSAHYRQLNHGFFPCLIALLRNGIRYGLRQVHDAVSIAPLIVVPRQHLQLVARCRHRRPIDNRRLVTADIIG